MANNAAIFTGMGMSQHTCGVVDNVQNEINLALITGNLGKPGTGVNPLRGQNNVQGTSDVGAMPNVLPPATSPSTTTRPAGASRTCGVRGARRARAHQRGDFPRGGSLGEGAVRDGREPDHERARRQRGRRALEVAGVHGRTGHLHPRPRSSRTWSSRRRRGRNAAAQSPTPTAESNACAAPRWSTRTRNTTSTS